LPSRRGWTKTLRVMLDTNIFDRIIQTPGLAGHLRSLTASGHLDFVVTHVQEDELARMTDAAKAREVQVVPRRLIATSVFLLGFSPLGAARLGGGDGGGLSLVELAGEAAQMPSLRRQPQRRQKGGGVRDGGRPLGPKHQGEGEDEDTEGVELH